MWEGGFAPSSVCLRVTVMALWTVAVYIWCTALGYLASCVVIAQAPGDGDPLCTDEVVNGMTNPFFFNRPTYSASERPLMDSRDYVGLLQGTDNPPWQSVDNDSNNTLGVVTEVRIVIVRGLNLLFPVVSAGCRDL